MGKKGKPSIGRSVINDRKKGSSRTKESWLHTSELNDGDNKVNYQSVTEQNALDEFLATAELAGTEFVAEKLNISVVPSFNKGVLPSLKEEQRIKQIQDDNRKFLKIPRRPAWDANTTAEQLEDLEKESFLDWRRNLAKLQEQDELIMTPFERNLEFWRQLWRVIERSDVVVQIVDARNPLLFHSEDLETYVKEVDQRKVCILLVNKADYLTQHQREEWSSYFKSCNITAVFWSAVLETERLKTLNESLATEDTDEPDSIVMDIAKGEETELSEESDVVKDRTQIVIDEETVPFFTSGHLLNGEELLAFCQWLHKQSVDNVCEEPKTVIGLVGYPNVGKSSTINAILQAKKVPVSATPGRTKHFQTLFVDENICLCDCPGLVFPSFVSTKAEMVISGILPIDQMRDHVAPVSLVCRRIPRHILENVYGINLPVPEEGEDPSREPLAEELLNAYGYSKGYMTSQGRPDGPRSARYILKDFVNGKLLYCHAPPGSLIESFQVSFTGASVTMHRKLPTTGVPISKTHSLDESFFEKKYPKTFTSASTGTEYHHRHMATNTTMNKDSTSRTTAEQKSWKKHGNRNKKEKLRRLYPSAS